MTPHELWVMRLMWRRGFSSGIISDCLGYSERWINEIVQGNRDMFPKRSKKMVTVYRKRRRHVIKNGREECISEVQEVH